MLLFKDQDSPTCTEVDPRLCFHWGASRAHYIDTLSSFNKFWKPNTGLQFG